MFILKFGLVDMTTRFEVLRPVSEDDLHTAPRITRVLKQFPFAGPPDRHGDKRHGSKGDCCDTLCVHVEKGILRRIPRFEELKKLQRLRFWSSQNSPVPASKTCRN